MVRVHEPRGDSDQVGAFAAVVKFKMNVEHALGGFSVNCLAWRSYYVGVFTVMRSRKMGVGTEKRQRSGIVAVTCLVVLQDFFSDLIIRRVCLNS